LQKYVFTDYNVLESHRNKQKLPYETQKFSTSLGIS